MRSTGAFRIADERQRQIEQEGWTPEHDKEHDSGELLEAAASYLYAAQFAAVVGHSPSSSSLQFNHASWPFEPEAWKPSDDPIKNLVKAGALIAAEIDRISA